MKKVGWLVRHTWAQAGQSASNAQSYRCNAVSRMMVSWLVRVRSG